MRRGASSPIALLRTLACLFSRARFFAIGWAPLWVQGGQQFWMGVSGTLAGILESLNKPEVVHGVALPRRPEFASCAFASFLFAAMARSQCLKSIYKD